MEIQTFFLAKEISKTGPMSEYDVAKVGLHHFFPADGKYPLDFSLPYFMLVRRSDASEDQDVALIFNLIDADGKGVGSPQNQKVGSTFPAGHRFMTIVGRINFSFPEEGDYRLDITSGAEETWQSVFSYNLVIGNMNLPS